MCLVDELHQYCSRCQFFQDANFNLKRGMNMSGTDNIVVTNDPNLVDVYLSGDTLSNMLSAGSGVAGTGVAVMVLGSGGTALPMAIITAAASVIVRYGADVIINKAGGDVALERGVAFRVNIAETVVQSNPLLGFCANVATFVGARSEYETVYNIHLQDKKAA